MIVLHAIRPLLAFIFGSCWFFSWFIDHRCRCWNQYGARLSCNNCSLTWRVWKNKYKNILELITKAWTILIPFNYNDANELTYFHACFSWSLSETIIYGVFVAFFIHPYAIAIFLIQAVLLTWQASTFWVIVAQFHASRTVSIVFVIISPFLIFRVDV